MPPVSETIPSGTLLGGRYRVGALLGQGGMGAVYDRDRDSVARLRQSQEGPQVATTVEAHPAARP